MNGRIGLSMKWMFGKGPGPLQEVGGLGSQGEYYYIPSKRPTLKAPPEAIGKDRVIPLFPRNQVLTPLGEEYLGVYEMRYRQMLNDVVECNDIVSRLFNGVKINLSNLNSTQLSRIISGMRRQFNPQTMGSLKLLRQLFSSISHATACI